MEGKGERLGHKREQLRPVPSLEEIAGKLKEEGFEIIIPPEGSEQFPETVDPEGLEGLSASGINALNTVVQTTRTFLGGVYVMDTYDDNLGTGSGRQQRNNAWVNVGKTLGPEYAKVRERDKMRLSLPNALRGFMDWLVIELDGANVQTPKADLIRRTYVDFLGVLPSAREFASMNYDKKKIAVERIDSVLRPFMRAMANG